MSFWLLIDISLAMAKHILSWVKAQVFICPCCRESTKKVHNEGYLQVLQYNHRISRPVSSPGTPQFTALTPILATLELCVQTLVLISELYCQEVSGPRWLPPSINWSAQWLATHFLLTTYLRSASESAAMEPTLNTTNHPRFPST